MEPSQKKFLNLAVPNILTNLTVPLAGLIDMALLGHLEDITPLAGVALATVIFDFLYWGCGFLRMSTTGLTAGAFGGKKHTECAAILLRGALLALVIGLGMVVLQPLLAGVGFSLLDGGAAVEAQGRAYFFARIWGAPALLCTYALTGFFLGVQRPRSALIMASTLNGLNILFDYWFIYILGWGAKGAGLATMLAEICAVLVGIWLVRRVLRGVKLPSRLQVLERSAMTKMWSLNGHILMRTFCLIGSFSLFTNISAGMGATVLAGNALLLRLLNTAAYFIDGFAFALESLAGAYAGAGKRAAMTRSLKLALGWNTAAVALFCLVFLLVPGVILGQLTSHTEVVTYGAAMMPYVSLCLLSSGFAYIFDGYFVGLAKGKWLMHSMIIAAVVGFLPLALWAWKVQSTHLLWWSMVGLMVLRAATLAPRIRQV